MFGLISGALAFSVHTMTHHITTNPSVAVRKADRGEFAEHDQVKAAFGKFKVDY